MNQTSVSTRTQAHQGDAAIVASIPHEPTFGFVTSDSQKAQVHACYAALRDWDLGVVARYCVEEEVYQPNEIADVQDEYAKFLALAITFGQEPIPISSFLDDFWHAHILFTQDYAAMCKSIAGRFIHHRPRILDDESELTVSFQTRTLDIYRQCFGEPNRNVWDSTLCKCGPDE